MLWAGPLRRQTSDTARITTSWLRPGDGWVPASSTTRLRSRCACGTSNEPDLAHGGDRGDEELVIREVHLERSRDLPESIRGTSPSAPRPMGAERGDPLRRGLARAVRRSVRLPGARACSRWRSVPAGHHCSARRGLRIRPARMFDLALPQLSPGRRLDALIEVLAPTTAPGREFLRPRWAISGAASRHEAASALRREDHPGPVCRTRRCAHPRSGTSSRRGRGPGIRAPRR